MRFVLKNTIQLLLVFGSQTALFLLSNSGLKFVLTPEIGVALNQ
jgi:hypothetical protein